MPERDPVRQAHLEQVLARHRDDYAELTDEEIVALVRAPSHVVSPMEMTRRLIVSTRELREAIDRFEKTSARLTAWLIGLTLLLTIFTLVAVVVAVYTSAK